MPWTKTIARSTVSNLLAPELKEVYAKVRARVKNALLPGGPLESPLEAAYDEACGAFIDTLRTTYGARLDAETEVKVHSLMEDRAFINALRQLPFVPFGEISTEVSRDEFASLRIQGAEPVDFDNAWNVLRRRFFLAAGRSHDLNNLLSMTLAAATEQRTDDLLQRIDSLSSVVEDLLRERQISAPSDTTEIP